jgi:tetratricopeptide (TPR) repeat protein
MYDAFMIAVLPIIWILLNITSFIVICIYEFSHAIPALIFAKGEVTVYIGVYGDNTAPRLKLGRLVIHIRPKFNYLKNRGMCIYKTDIPFTLQFIILVFAPIVVLAIACLLFHYTFFSTLNIYLRVGLGVALTSVAINLIVNLFPKKLAVKFSNRLVYSDGYEMILLGENSSNYLDVIVAAKFYDEGDFANAQLHLRKVEDKFMDESIFRMILASYVELKNYNTAKKFNKKFVRLRWYKLIGAYDYCNLAIADIGLQDYKEALINLDKSIKLDAHNFTTRKKRGYVYNILKNYEEAKQDLNKAVFINESSADVFGYRAFSNLKLGRPGEALIDIEKGLALDENNAPVNLARGIYLFDKGNYKLAMESLKKAKKFDDSMLWVDEYMAKTKEKLPRPKPRAKKTKADA